MKLQENKMNQSPEVTVKKIGVPKAVDHTDCEHTWIAIEYATVSEGVSQATKIWCTKCEEMLDVNYNCR